MSPGLKVRAVVADDLCFALKPLISRHRADGALTAATNGQIHLP
jgi:hypothetical protein